MTEWQPIETAPKDRSILVTEPDGLRIDQVIWGGWALDDTHNWCDADGAPMRQSLTGCRFPHPQKWRMRNDRHHSPAP